jgi:predicted anti-sigma-YlaC factor YlaD
MIMHRTEAADDHERFKEFCALAQAGSLGVVDQREVREHLKNCDTCRRIYNQYAAIGSEGMAFLSGCHEVSEEAARWDDREVRQKLLAAIQQEQAYKIRS